MKDDKIIKINFCSPSQFLFNQIIIINNNSFNFIDINNANKLTPIKDDEIIIIIYNNISFYYYSNIFLQLNGN